MFLTEFAEKWKNSCSKKVDSNGHTSRAKVDFESEVKLISNVHHRNLVRLLGCSRKGSEFLLVYEYMANYLVLSVTFVL